MVKKFEYDKKTKIISFDTKLHTLNLDKSSATLIPPFPALKKLGDLNKENEYEVTIKKK